MFSDWLSQKQLVIAENKGEDNITAAKKPKEPNEGSGEKFYASDDSDNESDFDVLYEPTDDNYADVAAGLVPTKPIYLTDCMFGLRSDDWQRQ